MHIYIYTCAHKLQNIAAPRPRARVRLQRVSARHVSWLRLTVCVIHALTSVSWLAFWQSPLIRSSIRRAGFIHFFHAQERNRPHWTSFFDPLHYEYVSICYYYCIKKKKAPILSVKSSHTPMYNPQPLTHSPFNSCGRCPRGKSKCKILYVYKYICTCINV